MRAPAHPAQTRSARTPPLTPRGLAAFVALLLALVLLALRPALLFAAALPAAAALG